LSNIAKVFDGNHMTIKDEFSDEGIRYLRGQDLGDLFISDSNPVYIPRELYDGMPRCHMKPDDVLLSVIGTVGSVSLVTDKYDFLTGSCKIVILRADKVNPYFLAAYLMSDIGQGQIQRRVRGAVQQGLILPDLKVIPVPTVSDEHATKVGSLIKQSLQQKRDSVNLYAEAERLLAAELGLNRLDLSESLFNVRRVSDVFNSKRLDAEFYQEKYYRLEDVITHHKYSSKTLSKLIEPIKNGFDFREFTKEGTPYIRVGDVRKGRIDFDNAAKIPVNSEEVQKDVGIKVGDVLFTRKGTFGNAAVVRKGQVQAIISSEIMLLRLQKHIETPILPDYLALFLNSEFGYQQVTRKVHGVAYYSISQPDLAQVWVIAPPMDIQERLAGIIQASLEAEKDAKRLLAEAKSEVERLIEG
jgi:type I restriction enzyme M protein